MKEIQILILAILFSSTISIGQTLNNVQQKPFIEVEGTAEKEIVPDEIYIRIIIREKTENREKITVQTQEANLKTALASLGLDLKNLSLTDANADYMRVGWGKREVVEKKDYTYMVSDATTVGKVFEKLDELEIREAYISKLDHSKIEEFRKEMKIKAIKAAKEKANYLVEAIDETLGNPQIIRETYNASRSLQQIQGVMISNRVYDSSNYKEGFDKNADAVQFQKITVKSSIYVKFEIGK